MIYLVSGQQRIMSSDNIKQVNVEESLSLLEALKVIGVDTETEGFDPYIKNLLSLQLGNRDFQVVIDALTIDVLNYKNLLESADKTFLFWNAKFDLKFLYHKKIYPKKVFDGYLAEKLLYLGYPAGVHSMSLKSAGENYLGIELDKSIRGKINYLGLTEEVITYGAEDVAHLEDIILEQWKELRKKDLTRAIKVENQFVLPLAYMEYCGVHLDVNKWKLKMQKDKDNYDRTVDELNKWVVEHFPKDKRFTFVDLQGDLWSGFNTEPQCIINWDSPKQVIPLFKELGFNLLAKDKETGLMKDSIDAKVIAPQKDVSTIAPIYLKYKACSKVVGTYGQNFLDQINPVSHRIHTNFTQMGADTTRLTSGGKDKANKVEYVNLLNLPRDAETRACFTAEDGNLWISIDYSGQETYLMASIADDKAIIKELTEGSGDIHSLTAYLSYPEIPRDTPIKEIKNKFHDLRQEAKGIEFAFNYGGNADTIHRNKGIPMDKAQEIYNNYMKGFSGLCAYQNFRRKDWLNKGYILLNQITGHKAFIYGFEDLLETKKKMSEEGFWDYYRQLKAEDPSSDTVQMVKKFFKRKSDSERQSINFPIQAAGSMCLRYSMIYLWEYIVENNLQNIIKICICPYDEINIEAPEEMAYDIADKVHDFMVKAGSIFCTKCKLDADISYDDNGKLTNYWIH